MKKYYQYLGLAIIMVFSFYYTEEIATIVLNKNPLMIKINAEKENAIIEGDYIIPGLNGLEVNTRESFYKMHNIDTFNEYFLVYDQIEPKISLNNNKDKIIKEGNKTQKRISLILEENNDVANYLKNNNIKANILVTLETYQKDNYFESINNDISHFKSLENNLNLNKENKNICVLNMELKKICQKYRNYLVEPTLKLTNNNLIEVKKNIQNGSIILITKNAQLTDIKILIKEINFKNLSIVPLSKLISEEYPK